MTELEFQRFCNGLAADPKGLAAKMSINSTLAHMMHAALGVCTEAGEIADIVKKEFAYSKIPDTTHMKEEIGDLLHYLTYICAVYGWTLEDCRESNVRKLQARYPDGFTTKDALNRNLEAERLALGK